MWLFIAFLLVPLIEIGLFIQVGGLIGLWPTLGIVIITAILGTWLVRKQGALALGQLRSSFSELKDPTEPLAHGAMILVSGALLLTPGFFTDAFGFLLLIPGFRTIAYRYIRARVKVQRFEMGQRPGGPARQPKGSGPVIDGDYEEVGEDQRPPKRPTHGPSGWTRH